MISKSYLEVQSSFGAQGLSRFSPGLRIRFKPLGALSGLPVSLTHMFTCRQASALPIVSTRVDHFRFYFQQQAAQHE